MSPALRVLVAALTLFLSATSARSQVRVVLQGAEQPGPLLQKSARLDVENVSVADALKALSEASGIPIAFSPSILARETLVSCSCRDRTVAEALDHLLHGTSFTYSELDGVVVIIPPLIPESTPSRLAPKLTPLVARPALVSDAGRTSRVRVPPSGSIPRQQESIAGVVVNGRTSEPIQAAQVAVDGTDLEAITNAQGQFRIDGLEGEEVTLRVSVLGYATVSETVRVGDQDIRLALNETAIALDEVVVTAIGVERERTALGYSITQVRAQDLVSATEASAANLLQGQVAGVHVAPVGGGPGASTRVTIRGTSSIADDNQPLYVVDGIPIDNTNTGSAGRFGGFDGGDGIQSLSPADIESMTVLKGAAAAALYGERARDGVILITTKQGRPGQTSINLTSTTTIDQARVGHADFQAVYGQGTNGLRPQNQQAAYSSNYTSWGEPFDGQPTIQWDGVERPYNDLGSQARNFYRRGVSTRNDISVTGGSPANSYYFSVSRLDDQGIVPGTDLRNTALTLRGTSTIGRLSADVKANYINEKTNRKGWLSDVPLNIHTGVNRLARNVPLSSLEQNYKITDSNRAALSGLDLPLGSDLGMEVVPIPNAFFNNPYFIVNELSNWDERNRLIGHVKLDVQLFDGVSLTSRTGLDWASLRRSDVLPWGNARATLGQISENEWRTRELQSDLFLRAIGTLTPSISIDGILGGALRNRTREQVGATGSTFADPDLPTLGNTENLSPSYSFSEKEVRSLYGTLNLGYRDYLFMNLTGRNDWSSTLAKDDNSFFYPSIGVSFLFADAFASAMPRWLSHGQLRASWAEVGSDTDPYELELTYAFNPAGGGTHQGQPLGHIPSSTVPLSTLKPTTTRELELGFDVGLLGDRVAVDFAWYDRQTINQILTTSVSPSTGYTGRRINAGRLDNTGFEVQLTLLPLVRPRFLWKSTVSYGRNTSRVAKLVEGQELLTFGRSRWGNAWIAAQAGEEFGVIRGYPYLRDDDGNIVHENGLPVQGELTVLGRGTPSWTGGWSNTISYGAFSLSALIDAEWGGQLFSGTNSQLYGNGLHKSTLQGRAECDANRGPTGEWEPCFVGTGVDISGGSNTTPVLPNAYYGRISGQITEEFIYDKNVITMRQLQVSVALPARWISPLGIRSASASIVGRNLFFLYNPIPNVDPDGNYNRGNAAGLESDGIPQTRSIGLQLGIEF